VHGDSGAGGMHRGNKVGNGADLVGRLSVRSGGQVGKVSDDLDPGRPGRFRLAHS